MPHFYWVNTILQTVSCNPLATPSAAGILLLTLLLGGLLGVWSKTGSTSFAEFMTERFVTGIALQNWSHGVGVLFFQGGTISTVLVGTTVKPMADKAGVSHEELAYVVDSTASPIASVPSSMRGLLMQA